MTVLPSGHHHCLLSLHTTVDSNVWIGIVWGWKIGCQFKTSHATRRLTEQPVATLAAKSQRHSLGASNCLSWVFSGGVWCCCFFFFFLYKASSSSLNLKSWEGSGDPPGTSNPNLFILFPFHFHNNCGMSLSVTTSSQLAEIKVWWHLEEPGSHWLSSLAKNWQSQYKDDSCQGNYVTSFCNKAVKKKYCEPHQIEKKVLSTMFAQLKTHL